MSKIPLWQPAWQQDAVEIVSSRLVHNGFYKVRQYELKHKRFDGSISPLLNREQMFRQDAAAALLFDPNCDVLVLVEQLRTGMLEHRQTSPWLLEIVAGLVEVNEAPEHCIMREAQEEVGCEIKSLHPISCFYNSPGGFAEKTSLYLGLVDSKQCRQYGGNVDEHEDILVHQLDAQAVIDAFGTWETSASTFIALQWFSQHYSQKDWVSSISET